MDGLMDAADGIFAHQSRERTLEIMKDSRVGNFGVLVGISALVVKFSCLSALSNAALPVVLFLLPAWARCLETYAIARFPYLRTAGEGKIWHDTSIYPKDVLLSGAPVILATVLIFVFNSHNLLITFFTTFGAILFGALSAHWFDQKLGGQTGDTYGSVVEVSETLGILLVTLLAVAR